MTPDLIVKSATASLKETILKDMLLSSKESDLKN
jgi:hypothetical protein